MKIVLALSVVVVVAIVALLYSAEPPKTYSLSTIEVVESDAARMQGLSGREEVPDDYGMLFVFPEKKKYGFWMKDMKVSIDIFWLADNGTIVGIEHSVSPDTYPTAFISPAPVRYVLETRAGMAQARGWDVGTMLMVPIP